MASLDKMSTYSDYEWEEFSGCCDAAVEEYSSLQYPPNVTPYSRCLKCGDMARVHKMKVPGLGAKLKYWNNIIKENNKHE
jgi:hypothetical protein